MLRISLYACSNETPSRRRATAYELPRPRTAREAAPASGRMESGSRLSGRRSVKPGGITPITVRGPPSVESVMSSTSWRPPRRRCQNSWLSTMTALLPPRILLGRVGAAERRLDAQRAKDVGGDGEPVNPTRLAADDHGDARRVPPCPDARAFESARARRRSWPGAITFRTVPPRLVSHTATIRSGSRTAKPQHPLLPDTSDCQDIVNLHMVEVMRLPMTPFRHVRRRGFVVAAVSARCASWWLLSGRGSLARHRSSCPRRPDPCRVGQQSFRWIDAAAAGECLRRSGPAREVQVSVSVSGISRDGNGLALGTFPRSVAAEERRRWTGGRRVGADQDPRARAGAAVWSGRWRALSGPPPVSGQRHEQQSAQLPDGGPHWRATGTVPSPRWTIRANPGTMLLSEWQDRSVQRQAAWPPPALSLKSPTPDPDSAHAGPCRARRGARTRCAVLSLDPLTRLGNDEPAAFARQLDLCRRSASSGTRWAAWRRPPRARRTHAFESA